MKFCVRHRAKDGSIAETTIEAADRNGVFAELARRGISAISVTEGEAKLAKGRRDGLVQRRSGSDGRLLLALSVLLILVVVGGGIWWFIRRDATPQGEPTRKTKGLIASHAPSAAGGETDGAAGAASAASTVATSATLSDVAISNETASAAAPKPNKKFRIVRPNKGKKLFHNVADVYISRLVNSTPGSGVIGTMNYDRFAEQLTRALAQPITIDEDDTPEEVAKKQAVIETRAELKQMLDDGVDVAKVMQEAESEMRRLWDYRRSLHLELAKAHKEGTFNSVDMRDYIDAANKMLTDNGMEPLKHPEFWLRRLKMEESERK